MVPSTCGLVLPRQPFINIFKRTTRTDCLCCVSVADPFHIINTNTLCQSLLVYKLSHLYCVFAANLQANPYASHSLLAFTKISYIHFSRQSKVFPCLSHCYQFWYMHSMSFANLSNFSWRKQDDAVISVDSVFSR